MIPWDVACRAPSHDDVPASDFLSRLVTRKCDSVFCSFRILSLYTQCVRNSSGSGSTVDIQQLTYFVFVGSVRASAVIAVSFNVRSLSCIFESETAKRNYSVYSFGFLVRSARLFSNSHAHGLTSRTELKFISTQLDKWHQLFNYIKWHPLEKTLKTYYRKNDLEA